MVGLEYLGADVRSFHVELHIIVVCALFSYLLQIIESLFAVASLMSACLRHTAHPFQLRAIQVVGACYLGIRGVYAFLAFLQIVAVITFVRIKLFVIYLNDFRAYSV